MASLSLPQGDGHPQSWWYKEGWHTKVVCGLLEAEWGLTTGCLPNTHGGWDHRPNWIGQVYHHYQLGEKLLAGSCGRGCACCTPFSLGSCPLCPMMFQRLMDRHINGLKSFAAAYLDDVVIYYSSTREEHQAHIWAVFECLREAGLTVKPWKCQFGISQCVYLGHIVGSGVVYPEKGKIQAVSSLPVPKTKKQVRTFLGLTGYYHHFIPSYAAIAAPLTDLTRKNYSNQVRWAPGCNVAFCKPKTVLRTAPTRPLLFMVYCMSTTCQHTPRIERRVKWDTLRNRRFRSQMVHRCVHKHAPE